MFLQYILWDNIIMDTDEFSSDSYVRECNTLHEFICSEYKNIQYFRIGDTYDSFQILDTNVNKPSKEEFEKKFEFFKKTTQPLNYLRYLRNQKIANTDYLMVPDFPFPSDEIRTSWIEYRQKLRDITATQKATINEEYKLVVTWPTPPIWPPDSSKKTTFMLPVV
tara:strand:- start:26 stop:520 length:495 start_codon:yes stop_codon:yes gene_type:complete